MDTILVQRSDPRFSGAIMAADASDCAKQKVGACVWHPDYGLLGAGNNGCDYPSTKCPREVDGYPSGEGYHLCVKACGQRHHAEVAAIKHARECVPAGLLVGATIFLWGHHYSCAACQESAREAGIAHIAFPV